MGKSIMHMYLSLCTMVLTYRYSLVGVMVQWLKSVCFHMKITPLVSRVQLSQKLHLKKKKN